jgi:hypothetical protein
LDGDTADVRLQLAPGSELGGSIEIAGDPPEAAVEKRTVRLETGIPNGPFEELPFAQTLDDRTFRLSDVFPGKYRLSVLPLPDDGYIKSVTLDGAAQGTLVDLTRDGSRLKVILSRNGGRISGTVVDQDGNPPANTMAIVFLMQDPEHLDQRKAERVDPDGRYSFKGIAPGKYRLLAIDALHSETMDGEDALKRLFEHAEEIEVGEGQRLSRNIRAAAKESSDAKAKE